MNKQNKDKHPVDQYMEQAASRIPVSFDARHWESLASMLDEEQTPKPGSDIQQTKTEGRAATDNGLIALVLFLIVFIGSFSFWLFGFIHSETTITNDPSNSHMPAPVVQPMPENEVTKEMPLELQALDKKLIIKNKNAPSLSSQMDPLKESIENSTNTENNPELPAQPLLDTLSGTKESLPIKADTLDGKKKKKKHLFW
jgi:hypothetical protein